MDQVYKLHSTFNNEDKTFLIDYEKELNEEQLPIVKAESGPILIIAGAGSGKTRTVTYRVAYLVESGIPLKNILLMTFTNKASKEMLNRVGMLLNMNLSALWAGTFHHIGNLILRKHAKKIGYDQNFTILDRADSKDLISSAVKEAGFNTTDKKFPTGDILQDIYSYLTNSQKTLAEVITIKYPNLMLLQAELEVIMKKYDEMKREQNLMYFDDLLSKWLKLFLEHPDVKAEYSERFQQILVDEYQDTNTLQAQIIDLMASSHRNLMVVGDDSQAIYSFRAAEFRNIIDFPKRYADAKMFKIETNHRSTPEILGFANDSISNAEEKFEKQLRPIRKAGTPPAVVSFRDVFQQATFIGQRILELVDEGTPLNEIAIIYRSHYHCLEIQMELTKRRIPFEVRSGIRFWEEAHIKDVLAYLKVFQNPYDGLAWSRILRILPGVGQKTAEKIWKAIQKTTDPIKALEESQGVPKAGDEAFLQFKALIRSLSGVTNCPSAMIEMILKGGYEEHLKMTYPNSRVRIEEIEELSSYALEYPDLEKLLSGLALTGGVGAEEISGTTTGEKQAVILTTVHQAKGLEWKVVFIIWLAEGRFPSYLSFQSPKDIEEERRLFYVAVTRSKDQLYLTYPMSFRSREGTMMMKSSRFIKEISEHRYQKWLVEEDLPTEEIEPPREYASDDW